MTKAEKIDKIQEAIAKLEEGIVKISERASQKKTSTPMSDAFEKRFEKYGPLPVAAALLETEPKEFEGSLFAYTNMMMKLGHLLLCGTVAVLESPILLGRTVVGLFNGFAYKLGNVRIDRANERLAKMRAQLEEKREVLNELIGLDNEERKLAEKADENAVEME